MWATARQILFCLSSKLPAQTGESFGICPFPGLTLRGSQKAGTDDAMRLYLLLACYYFSGLKLLCQVGEHCVIQTKFPGKMGEISISMTKAEKRRRALMKKPLESLKPAMPRTEENYRRVMLRAAELCKEAIASGTGDAGDGSGEQEGEEVK